MSMTPRVRAALDAADRTITMAACLAVLAMMFIVGADVLCRYALGAPIPWAYDLISMFLTNAVLYLVLSEALRTRHHLGLDLSMPPVLRPLMRTVAWLGWLLVLAVVLTMACVLLQATWESWRSGERVAGRYEWIVWIKLAIVAGGTSMLTLRIALMLLPGGGAASVPGTHAVAAEPRP
ncbi:MAG: TRAP transporter small permease [Burkholderiaceae bacterium]